MAGPAAKSGLTLIEFMLVLAVIAILVLLAVPALMSIVPSAQLRGSARSVLSLMQKARLLAENSQKPARVTLDCRFPANSPVCQARLETAVFQVNPAGEVSLKEWARVGGETIRDLARRVTVEIPAAGVKPIAPALEKIPLSFVVFLPSGEVRASYESVPPSRQEPFRLTFRRPGIDREWELTVDRVTGRAALKWLE